eukprot:UN16306
MGTAIDLSQKLGLRLTPRFYYGGVKCVAEDGNHVPHDQNSHFGLFIEPFRMLN